MSFIENIDKNKLQKIMIIVISVLTVIALGLLLTIIIASVSDGISEGLGETELKEYTVTDKDLAIGNLILADDSHPYSVGEDQLDLLCSGGKTTAEGKKYGCGDYRDENLEKDDAGNILYKYYMNDRHEMQLTKEAMAHAHKMFIAAEKAVGLNQLFIEYSYGFSEENVSEYNTALLVSMAGYTDDGKIIDLPDAYSEWFDRNAASYGFVESFENGYRYVGEVHAKYMVEKNLSLAEYIAYLKEKTDCTNALKISTADGTYAVYKYDCSKAGDVIKVPSNNEYTLSGTNDGCIIVTYKMK